MVAYLFRQLWSVDSGIVIYETLLPTEIERATLWEVWSAGFEFFDRQAMFDRWEREQAAARSLPLE